MKIIHTSDWHLGNRLLGHSRQNEFQAFLAWLLVQLEEQQADALLISGDIFDNGNPGEYARALYCDFLSKADATGCRHIIITAGNHDSTAQLAVTKPLLERLHCHVVTHLTHDPDSIAQCLIPLSDVTGRESALVCAVPFLRVPDVALPADKDDEEGRRTSYPRGIAALYTAVGQQAEAWKAAHPGCPVIGMGHLSVAGVIPTASTHDVIGTLSTVDSGIFPAVFDYTALGHIHRPSAAIEGKLLYCGSPLAMQMDEGSYEHKLLLIETEGSACRVSDISVPAFTQMAQYRCGSEAELHTMAQEIASRCSEENPLWLDFVYTGGDLPLSSVREYLKEQLPESIVPQRLVRKETAAPALRTTDRADCEADSLQHYTPELLFERRLAEYAAEHTELKKETLAELRSLFHTLLPLTRD